MCPSPSLALMMMSGWKTLHEEESGLKVKGQTAKKTFSRAEAVKLVLEARGYRADTGQEAEREQLLDLERNEHSHINT